MINAFVDSLGIWRQNLQDCPQRGEFNAFTLQYQPTYATLYIYAWQTKHAGASFLQQGTHELSESFACFGQ